MRDGHTTAYDEAHGLMLLGLFEDATTLMEALPTEQQFAPEMLPVQLMCALATGNPAQLIKRLACLADNHPKYKQALAAVGIITATLLKDEGRADLASHLVKIVVSYNPEFREQILKLPELAPLLDA